jgi:hydroxymethylbilane synthase
MKLFTIGARGSPLSVAQTNGVRRQLAAALGTADVDAALPFERIVTTGDRVQDRRLQEAGGKGLFTKELDEAMSDGRIDLAVHSLKDLPTSLPDGIVFACVPGREDPRDAFISPVAKDVASLPTEAVVGTASLRRQAQTLFARPDVRVQTLRGNVDTRLAKLAAGDAHATYLAYAGLKRLGLDGHVTALVDPIACPPAPCQGALAITARADDRRALEALALLQDASAWIEIAAERAFLAALDGSCRTPIGALARRGADGSLRFVGEALRPDGRARFRREGSLGPGATAADAAALGARLGAEVKAEGEDQILEGT